MIYNENMEGLSIPLLHGNWVDLVLIIIFLIYVIEGFRRGLIIETIDLLGFLISFLFALRFYSFFGYLLVGNFSIPRGIANALGFLIAGLLSESIFSAVLLLVIKKIPRILKESFLEKILGVVPAFLNALILSAFLLSLFISLPIKGEIKKAIISSKIGGPIVYRTQGFEKKLNLVFGGAINETLTFLTIKPSGDEKIDLKFKLKKEELSIDKSSEEKMLVLVNNEREKQGVNLLNEDSSLTLSAQKHCIDMFVRGYFSHYNLSGKSPFDRLENEGITFVYAGENLAFAPSVDIAHEGLMNSPGHKENILSPDFNKVGISVIDGGVYGKMFCQEFTN